MYNLLSFYERPPLVNSPQTDPKKHPCDHITEIYSTFGIYIDSIVKNRDQRLFARALTELYECMRQLLVSDQTNRAYDLLNFFKAELEVKGYQYSAEGMRFVEALDLTEIYHNLAFLSAIVGDLDTALHYFSSADRSYCRANSVNEGSYLTMLIDTPGMPFHVWLTHICTNCAGMGWFKPFEYRAFFGYDLGLQNFQQLLSSFNPTQCLQFMITHKRFWNMLSKGHTPAKAMIMTRLLGEMAWIIDIYIKTQTHEKHFYNSIQRLVKLDPELQVEFFDIDRYMQTMQHDNGRLENLVRQAEIVSNEKRKQVISLYTAYKMRNHTAHELDEEFLLFQTDEFTKKIYMLELMALFLSKQLLIDYKQTSRP